MSTPPTSEAAVGASPCFVFAGGGTGGHLMPALAIIERLRELRPDVRVLVLCADREIDRRILGPSGVDFCPIDAQPPALRPFPAAPLRFARAFTRSRVQAARAIEAFRGPCRGGETNPRGVGPSGADSCIVVAMGGFVSGPAAWAARFSVSVPRPPVVLVNLDRIPGRANRFVARLARHVITALDVVDAPAVFHRAEVVGLPIRRRALATEAADTCRRHFGLYPDRPTLLVTGASQGAQSLNRLMIALTETTEALDAMAGWQVLHLAGDAKTEDREALVTAYRIADLPARVIGFCEEMGMAWGAADLALSRAGASSVAEAAANCVPTVFAPYPWHIDRHQERNAEPLVARGGAWMTTDHVDPQRNLEGLGRLLVTAMGDPETLRRAAIALRELPRRDAAETVARRLIAWSEGSAAAADVAGGSFVATS